jgi:hypothetical protein
MIHQREQGAVSLFIVIFSSLLITMIAVGFIRIMIQNQEQATAADLSKSALDSAYAGVEDAKRLIVTYRQNCIAGAGTSTECQRMADLMKGNRCDTLQQASIVNGDKEVVVRQSEGDESLNQAYTCVKVLLDTPDIIGTVAPNTSKLIPLAANGAFDQITLEWYSQEDLSKAITNDASNASDRVSLYSGLEVSPSLPKLDQWPKNQPPLMRIQLLQFGDNFLLSDFDTLKDGKTNNASLFLMPSTAGSTTVSFADDFRQIPGSLSPERIACDKDFSTSGASGQYACKVVIRLPAPIGTDDITKRRAYIRVTELYNPNTAFRISLQNGAQDVVFSAVQPLVDSTGRANDYFRRIQSRIELESSSVPYVENAVDLTGSLCKTFRVTDQPGDYDAGSCTPN